MVTQRLTGSRGKATAKAPDLASTAKQLAGVAADHQTEAVRRFQTTRHCDCGSVLVPTCTSLLMHQAHARLPLGSGACLLAGRSHYVSHASAALHMQTMQQKQRKTDCKDSDTRHFDSQDRVCRGRSSMMPWVLRRQLQVEQALPPGCWRAGSRASHCLAQRQQPGCRRH